MTAPMIQVEMRVCIHEAPTTFNMFIFVNQFRNRKTKSVRTFGNGDDEGSNPGTMIRFDTLPIQQKRRRPGKGKRTHIKFVFSFTSFDYNTSTKCQDFRYKLQLIERSIRLINIGRYCF